MKAPKIGINSTIIAILEMEERKRVRLSATRIVDKIRLGRLIHIEP